MQAIGYVESLRKKFRANSDKERAVGMSEYMRDQFPFLGIASPLRKELQNQLVLEVMDVDDAFSIAEALWELEEREYQYTACDLLSRAVSRKAVPVFNPRELIQRTETLICSKSWWDTVDGLAPNVAGSIIQRSLRTVLPQIALDWVEQDNLWMKRSALILQLKYKADTDAELLFDLVNHVAASPEFFIRKGAGWALREYSKVNPTAVRGFLDANAGVLSTLTIHEASKYC